MGLSDIRQREVPEQVVLIERRHVDVDQLPEWIGAAMRRLAKSARKYGGAIGARFVVYYGEINEESDGPAQACVPIIRPTPVRGIREWECAASPRTARPMYGSRRLRWLFLRSVPRTTASPPGLLRIGLR